MFSILLILLGQAEPEPLRLSGPCVLRQDAPVDALAFSPDGRLLAVAAGRRIAFYDARAAFVRPSLSGLDVPDEQHHGVKIGALAFSPDGRRLAVAGGVLQEPAQTYVVARISFDGAAPLKGEPHAAPLLALAWSPAGALVCASVDGEVRLHPAQGPAVSLGKAGRTPFGAAFGADGVRPFTAGADRLLRLWDPAGGFGVVPSPALGRAGTGFAASSDGRLVALSGSDGRTVVLEAASGLPLAELEGQGAPVPALAFSPEGDRLALGGYDGLLRIWSFFDGRWSLGEPGGWVTSLAFSPDGRRLAAGLAGSEARVWRLDVEKRPDPTWTADLWSSLSGADGPAAWRAVRALASALRAGDETAAALLRDRLQPVAGESIEDLMTALDAEEFEAREKASAALERLGAAARPLLQKALEAGPSAELRTRIETLLQKSGAGALEPPDRLGVHRALAALERAGSTALLERMAGGSEGARPTLEAQASLLRLRARPGERR